MHVNEIRNSKYIINSPSPADIEIRGTMKISLQQKSTKQ